MISTGIFALPGQETLAAVAFSVAACTERNQILRYIIAKLTPRLHVVNLQVLHGAAVLAVPTVSF